MNKKINTKYFGEKNLLDIKKIPYIDELYIGEINATINHSRYRICGIFDDKYREVVPFGMLHIVFGTRVVNDNVVIIDCYSGRGYCYDSWHHSDINEGGSLLLMKDNEGFKHVYTSNASYIYVTHDMLYGANFEDFVRKNGEKDYTIKTFEYNYKENKLISIEKIKDNRADITGELLLYFAEKIKPYPDKMLRLEKVGNLKGKDLYEFHR